MTPTALLVETNWVVDRVAPAHLQSPEADRLLADAQRGAFELHLPAICLVEAREAVRRRYAPKARSDDMRAFA